MNVRGRESLSREQMSFVLLTLKRYPVRPSINYAAIRRRYIKGIHFAIGKFKSTTNLYDLCTNGIGKFNRRVQHICFSLLVSRIEKKCRSADQSILRMRVNVDESEWDHAPIAWSYYRRYQILNNLRQSVEIRIFENSTNNKNDKNTQIRIRKEAPYLYVINLRFFSKKKNLR